jgi:hypothetical protein
VKRRHHIKLVHEGDYVAEVDIELIYADIPMKDGHPTFLRMMPKNSTTQGMPCARVI